jgi:hypothetical protein
MIGNVLWINFALTLDETPAFRVSGIWQFNLDCTDKKQAIGSHWGIGIYVVPDLHTFGNAYGAGPLTRVKCPK